MKVGIYNFVSLPFYILCSYVCSFTQMALWHYSRVYTLIV